MTKKKPVKKPATPVKKTFKKAAASRPSQNTIDDFIYAAGSGDIRTINSYIEKYPKHIDIKDAAGDRALIEAACYNHINIARALIEAGADPNLTDDQNSTALNYAAYRGHVAVVEYLLSQKASPHIADNDGDTPLTRGYENIDIMRLLLKSGADINHQNKQKETALMKAVNTDKDNVAFLLERKANPNLQDSDGRTALHKIASSDINIDIAQVLLKAGADFEIKDNNGCTALDIATESKNDKLVKIMKAEKEQRIQREVKKVTEGMYIDPGFKIRIKFKK